MRGRACDRLDSVQEALRTGLWPTGLRQHADGCEDCSAELRLRRGFQEIAGATEKQPTLSARYIWLKAQFARRQENQTRTLRLVMWSQIAGNLAIGTGMLLLALWYGPEIQAWVRQFTAAWFEPGRAYSLSGATLAIALIGTAGVLVLVNRARRRKTARPG